MPGQPSKLSTRELPADQIQVVDGIGISPTSLEMGTGPDGLPGMVLQVYSVPPGIVRHEYHPPVPRAEWLCLLTEAVADPSYPFVVHRAWFACEECVTSMGGDGCPN